MTAGKSHSFSGNQFLSHKMGIIALTLSHKAILRINIPPNLNPRPDLVGMLRGHLIQHKTVEERSSVPW